MEGVEEERGEGRRQIWYAHRGDSQAKKNKNTVFEECKKKKKKKKKTIPELVMVTEI